MTKEQLERANAISGRINYLKVQLQDVEQCISNGQCSSEELLKLNNTKHKFSMSIRAVGWSGPTIADFSSEIILDVINTHKYNIELEIKTLEKEFTEL